LWGHGISTVRVNAMSKVRPTSGILLIVLAAVVLLAGCEGPSGDFYRTPSPCVEDIRNCDYPEPDTSFLAEQRRQEDEERQFRRNKSGVSP